MLLLVVLLYWTGVFAQTNLTDHDLGKVFGPPFKGQHESAKVHSMNTNKLTIPCLKPVANSRVMYGSPTGLFYRAPWSVHIKLSTVNGHENSCSGSLISPDLVITCGHCVDSGTLSEWRVYGGIPDGESRSSGTERSVKYFAIHPRFKNFLNPEASYDMAIISLTNPFVIKPGELEAIGFPRLGASEVDPISQPSTTVVDVIRPLDRWEQCQYRGSGKTFNQDGTKCIDGTALRYTSGVLMEPGCCAAVERAQNIEPGNLHPLGTIYIYNYTDASCPDRLTHAQFWLD
ncbi:Chymotrypsin-1-like protein [Aphelenchoides besseyi]|nr:Chymotrypsin-1-like protein [Aphelenchoides besseyi]